jgi:NAD-dependent DNA ligase
MSDIIKNIKQCKNSKELRNKLLHYSYNDIEKLIYLLNDSYYNNTSLVDDYIYDFIIDYIYEKYPLSKILNNIGHPTSNNKIKLPFYLGSENKVYDEDKLNSWLKKNNLPTEFVISAKADGVSILWDIENNKLYTRGDGVYGRDVTNFIPLFKPFKNKSIQKKINLSKILFIRGELVADRPMNRNIVSGQINSKIYDIEICKNIYFLAHEIISPRYTQQIQFEMLNKYNINTVSNIILKNNLNISLLATILTDFKKTCNYDIDGLIVRTNNLNPINTDVFPKWSISFKKNIEFADTKIISISWNISKHNNIIPTATVEPVILKNTNIQRVSCYNAKFVKDNKLGPGSVIRLIKSGDIIPHIDKIITHSINIKLPKGKWNGVHLEVRNNNDSIIKKIIEFFNILKIKNIYINVVKKLVDNYEIYTVYDLLNLHFDPINIQEKYLYDAIKNIKTMIVYDYVLLSSLSLKQLSIKRCEIIFDAYPNVIKDWYINKFDFTVIKGINLKLNDIIINEINKNYTYISNMFSYIKTNHKETISDNYDVIKIALSGFRNINDFLNTEYIKFIKLVSIKNAQYLISPDKTKKTSKIIYSIKNNIPIINIHELEKIIKYKINKK